MSINKEQKEHLKRLGLQLKKIRLLKGLTLKELGYLIDKDPQSISRVEMGDINPTYLYLLEVCKGLGVEIWEVLKSD
jgi:transcriptional regulator with XRE-family HTH domain